MFPTSSDTKERLRQNWVGNINRLKSLPVISLQIIVGDIEYQDKDSDLLQVMVVHSEYPPRFTVDVSGSGMTEESNAHFAIFGAKEDLVYKLPLMP